VSRQSLPGHLRNFLVPGIRTRFHRKTSRRVELGRVGVCAGLDQKNGQRSKTLVLITLHKTRVYNTLAKQNQTHERGMWTGSQRLPKNRFSRPSISLRRRTRATPDISAAAPSNATTIPAPGAQPLLAEIQCDPKPVSSAPLARPAEIERSNTHPPANLFPAMPARCVHTEPVRHAARESLPQTAQTSRQPPG